MCSQNPNSKTHHKINNYRLFQPFYPSNILRSIDHSMHHSSSINKHKEDSSDNYTKYLEIGDKKKCKMQERQHITQLCSLKISFSSRLKFDALAIVE
jgi:hypothetical protein